MPYILPKYPTYIFTSRTPPPKHCKSLNFFIKYIPHQYCVLFKNVDCIVSFVLLSRKKLEDGKCIGGAGRLTVARIDTMQSFYELSIRQNKGSSSAMSKAAQAILLHFSSTKNKLQHQCCPTGPNSWCSFQRDLALKTRDHRPIKDPFPAAVVKVIKPVFDKLADKNFLAGCESCSTQNANESLHHVIWGIAPKDQFMSQAEKT